MSTVMNNDQSKKSINDAVSLCLLFGLISCCAMQEGFDSQAHAVPQ
jgi:uncharacterized UBP type Zn finger protein